MCRFSKADSLHALLGTEEEIQTLNLPCKAQRENIEQKIFSILDIALQE
jgi:hypothetical protein